MAARYIGTEAADHYVLGIKKDGLIATLTPEQWFSVPRTGAANSEPILR
ncbi:hypothetical protein [Rhodococcus sovatensis]|uniref:Uncharacterized protein n=1 Tax=Rhodococcus sovatensis TaxID=1805840 RepID=A0ABZ2PIY4_9NOCA